MIGGDGKAKHLKVRTFKKRNVVEKVGCFTDEGRHLSASDDRVPKYARRKTKNKTALQKKKNAKLHKKKTDRIFKKKTANKNENENSFTVNKFLWKFKKWERYILKKKQLFKFPSLQIFSGKSWKKMGGMGGTTKKCKKNCTVHYSPPCVGFLRELALCPALQVSVGISW